MRGLLNYLPGFFMALLLHGLAALVLGKAPSRPLPPRPRDQTTLSLRLLAPQAAAGHREAVGGELKAVPDPARASPLAVQGVEKNLEFPPALAGGGSETVSQTPPALADRGREVISHSPPRGSVPRRRAPSGQGDLPGSGDPRPAAPLIRKPRPLVELRPIFPQGSRRRGEEGEVVIRVSVNATGDVEGVELLQSSGFTALDRSALQTVERAGFTPALEDGRPVPGAVTITFHFRLK